MEKNGGKSVKGEVCDYCKKEQAMYIDMVTGDIACRKHKARLRNPATLNEED